MDASDEEICDRRVTVENLPQGVEDLEQKLVIYFQRKKHGGGDVESVSVLDKDKAVVTFEEADVLGTLLDKEHLFMDTKLIVKPFRNNQEAASKVFRCVMAEVDPSIFSIDRAKLKEMLQELALEDRLKYREMGGNFLLSGSLQKINLAHDKLSEKVKMVERKKEKSESPSSSAYLSRDTGLVNGVDESLRKEDQENGGIEQEKPVKSDESCSILPFVCQIKPEMMKFFIRLYKPKLEEIEEIYHVNIRCQGQQSAVAIFPSDENPTNTAKFRRACEKVKSLYEEALNNTITDYLTPLSKDEESSKHLRQVVSSMQKRKEIVVERAPDRSKWIIYGKREDVADTKKEISKYVGISNDSSSDEETKRKRQSTASPTTPKRDNKEISNFKNHTSSKMFLPVSVEKKLSTPRQLVPQNSSGKYEESRKQYESRNEAKLRDGSSIDKKSTLRNLHSTQPSLESIRLKKGRKNEDGATNSDHHLNPTNSPNLRTKSGRYPVNRFANREFKHPKITTIETCPVCLGPQDNPVTLPKCKHVFCKTCVEAAFEVKKICPLCKEAYLDDVKGNQPPGEMTYRTDHHSLPGFSGCGRIVISYKFSGGVQGSEHDRPGEPYNATSRCAYLPDNTEGNKVLELLKKAFDARLVFTIGYSMTTFLPNQIIWADIEHKTNVEGGVGNYGYPDPDYLRRVTEQLASFGIN